MPPGMASVLSTDLSSDTNNKDSPKSGNVIMTQSLTAAVFWTVKAHLAGVW